MLIAVKHVVADAKTGRLSYRRLFPKHLRERIPGRPQGVKRSLGAKDLSAPGAAKALTDARAEYDRLISQANKVVTGAFDLLDRPLIDYLASLHGHRVEDDDERAWKHLPASQAFHAGSADLEGDWEVSRAMLAAFDRPGIVRYWGERVAAYTRDLNFTFDPTSEAFGDLCEAVAVAACEAWVRIDNRRYSGMPGMEPTRPAPVAPTAPQRPGASSANLMPLFEEYAGRRVMTPGVRAEYSGFVRDLIAHLGHDDALRVTKEDIRRFRDQMLETPSRKGRSPEPTTVKKRIGVFKSLFKWAVEEGRLRTNVARDVSVNVPRKAVLRSRDFTEREAHAILAATLATAPARMASGHLRARRWVPWLCAYTGARVGEIAQLRKEDISQIGGAWTINITPDAGTVKSKVARLVPLHSHLIEQGFPEVLEGLPDGPIFYDPARQRKPGEGNRHIKKVGERLADWVRKEVGVTDNGVSPNHGWRHLFKTTALEAGIEGRIADAITGHAPDTEGKRYGEVSLKTKARAIESFPRYEVGE